MREAKACPFCGGTNLATPPGIAIVVCGDCEASGPVGKAHPTNDALTVLAAFTKWNTRTDPWAKYDLTPAEIEAMLESVNQRSERDGE